MKRKILIPVVCGLLLIIITGLMINSLDTGFSSENMKTIKIGLINSISGENSAGTSYDICGSELANIDRPTVTLNGEVYNIQLVTADNKNTKEGAKEATEKLAEEGVAAVIGSYTSTPSIAAGEVIKEKKIIGMGTCCTNVSVTEDNPYYYRVCFIDSVQGTALANYVNDNISTDNVLIVYNPENSYAVGLIDAFKKTVKKKTEEITYKEGQTDYSELTSYIKDNGIKCVFLPGDYAEAGLIIKSVHRMSPSVTIIGGDTYNVPDIISIAGKDKCNNVFFSSMFHEEADFTSKTKAYNEDFKNRIGIEPIDAGLNGYDAYNVLLDAMEKAQSSDPEAMREALNSIEYEGVSGNIKFDESGNPDKPVVLIEIKDGQFTYKGLI